jgi:hypothetical protein
MTMSEPNEYASPEQIRYAKVLSTGVKIGFVLLVVSFFLYMTGILKPLVPVDQLPKYWGLSADEFVKTTGTPTGWGWLKMIVKGDMLNYFGIVVLASISIFSTFAVLPIFSRNGEKAHLVISIALILVLLISASNILH